MGDVRISWVLVGVVGIMVNWLLSVYYYNDPNIREIAAGKRPIKPRENNSLYNIYYLYIWYFILVLPPYNYKL